MRAEKTVKPSPLCLKVMMKPLSCDFYFSKSQKIVKPHNPQIGREAVFFYINRIVSGGYDDEFLH